ncbi:MAG: RsmB/NOP family class I SAM-dependent RNA methyltransferase [Parachlamydiaceae bacterium]|nr:RsmB/NOP family class I SAM-dependent RNA methyltransferase [Parachlamydiaceae bacterium]
MIKIPFREHHLFSLLESYSMQKLPLDLCIHQYFRQHPALGSKDRAFIAETTYSLVRWQILLDHLGATSWQERYTLSLNLDLESLQEDKSMPSSIQVSCPQELYDCIFNTFGEQVTQEICLINNEAAPTFVRANLLKTTRDELLNRWKETYEVSPTKTSPHGIIFHKKINFFQLPEFKEGLFEVQDEGSQLLADLIQSQPGDLVLDYCAGSGGKTLAFAPRMEGKGQIYVHDIRPHALQEARLRLRRAGIQNAQTILPDQPHLEKLKKKMNWVLVDAPCSGTGTLRRNPDMKSKFSKEMLSRLVGQQRMIFEKALSFLHPTGRIVYGTCSILKEENQEQLDHFIKTYGLEIENSPFQSIPAKGEMDGFFGVVLKRIQ